VDRLATIPNYVIHSRDDEGSPVATDEHLAKQLMDIGRPGRFQALSGLGHYEMYRYVDALKGAGRWVADQWRRRSIPGGFYLCLSPATGRMSAAADSVSAPVRESSR